jgi:hypothetical protein
LIKASEFRETASVDFSLHAAQVGNAQKETVILRTVALVPVRPPRQLFLVFAVQFVYMVVFFADVTLVLLLIAVFALTADLSFYISVEGADM